MLQMAFLLRYTPLGDLEQTVVMKRPKALPGKKAWEAWSKSGARPPDIPADPRYAYNGKGWAGYGDWLGTGTVKHNTGNGRRGRPRRGNGTAVAVPDVPAPRVPPVVRPAGRSCCTVQI